MPVIKNQIGGHASTLDLANVNYTLANISVNTAVETVQRMGVSKILWTGDWVISQGANVVFRSPANTAGFWDLSAQGIVFQGSNAAANIVANTAGTTSTLVMTVTKYANNNAGVG